MTHDELLANIDLAYGAITYAETGGLDVDMKSYLSALRAVVELHKPDDVEYTNKCSICYYPVGYGEFMFYKYPCPTIQAIEKELK